MTVYLTMLLDVNFFFFFYILLQSEAACVGTVRPYSRLGSFLYITYTPCVQLLTLHSLDDLSSGPQPEKRTDKTKTLAGVLHGCVPLPVSEVGGNTRVHV